jgi:uncharacterized protein (DUF2062 family)
MEPRTDDGLADARALFRSSDGSEPETVTRADATSRDTLAGAAALGLGSAVVATLGTVVVIAAAVGLPILAIALSAAAASLLL